MWDAHGFKVLYTLSLNAKMVRRGSSLDGKGMLFGTLTRELVAYMLTANCLFWEEQASQPAKFLPSGVWV